MTGSDVTDDGEVDVMPHDGGVQYLERYYASCLGCVYLPVNFVGLLACTCGSTCCLRRPRIFDRYLLVFDGRGGGRNKRNRV